MPEGPEVKTTVNWLLKFKEKTIESFVILSGRYLKKNKIPGWDKLEYPALLKNVQCKGKFIYFTFSGKQHDSFLFSTLGMTGMWSNSRTKHSRVVLSFKDEEPLYYNDIRNFGTLKFVETKKELDKKLNSLGPDILASEINTKSFLSRLTRKHNKTIAECLMNQSVISGVGNYLKAEILYASKISPNRKISDITENEWITLCENILVIARRSYRLGGATIESYRQPNGEKGLYSQRFAVYNQSIAPCGNNVIKETTADKRTTHWVPEIQK